MTATPATPAAPRPARVKPHYTPSGTWVRRDGTPFLLDGHTPDDPPPWTRTTDVAIPAQYLPEGEPVRNYPTREQWLARRRGLFLARYRLLSGPLTAGDWFTLVVTLLGTLALIGLVVGLVVGVLSLLATVLMGCLGLSFLVFVIKVILY